MTIRDPEVLEALRDEPELLALADAVGETQQLPRTPRRRALSPAAAIAAIGAAALVAFLLWPGGGSRNPILDRALAAIGDGPVLHLVTRIPTGQQLVNLRTGRTVIPTEEIESWSNRSATRFHMIIRADGRVVGEALYPEDRSAGATFGPVDPAYAALWTGYRDALASGKAKIERDGMLFGHDVYWVSFPPKQDSLVAIDRKSYEPVAFRSVLADGRNVDYRVLLARTEPFSAKAFKRKTPAPNPLTCCSLSAGSGTGTVSPSAPFKLRAPWLTAGPSIAGLKLSSAGPLQETSGGRTTTGVELVYGTGAQGVGRRSLTVDELKHPGDLSDWNGIRPGFARITEGMEGSQSQGGTSSEHTIWTADLVSNGLYVTITSGVSRAAVLEAARALRPA